MTLGGVWESWHNHWHAVVVVADLATQWMQSYPCKRTSQETNRNLQKFLEPARKINYTDNSPEFGKASDDISWKPCTSTPHRSETSGTVYRKVRKEKKGTSAVLLQSSLDENLLANFTGRCLRNIQIRLSDEKTQSKDILVNHVEDRLFWSVHR